MRHKLHIFLSLCAVLAIVGCTGSGSPRQEGTLSPAAGSAVVSPAKGASDSPHNPDSEADTVYTEAAAMSIHLSDPERAIVMIDSGVTVGNIAWERGEYLKAVTQYGQEKHALARQTCLDLLNQPQIAQTSDIPTVLHTYMLLTSIENSFANYPAVIRYATKASQLAHELDMPESVGEIEGYITKAMAKTGSAKEGIDRLRTVIVGLRQTYTFNGMMAYYSTSKSLLHILDDNERYGEMVSVCEDMLEHIGEFANHYDHFANGPNDFDPKDFEDFARGQTLAFLTIAYARQVADNADKPALRQQFLQKALATEAEMELTRWSKTIDCARMMTSAYHYLGQFDRFDEAMDRVDATRADTLNNNYFISLTMRCAAAEMRGRTAEAYHYLQRANVIRDSLDAINQREQLNELATLYHLQEEQIARKEEQMARQEAEADARFFRWIAVAVIVILALAIAFAAYFFYKRRETMEKNRALVRMIDETHPRPLPMREGNIYPQEQNGLTPSPSPSGEGSIHPQEQNGLTPNPSPRGEGSIYLQESDTHVGTRRVASAPVPTDSDPVPTGSDPMPATSATESTSSGPVPATSDPVPASSTTLLFHRFTSIIHDEQLYRDVSLDRDAVCQRLGIDRHVLNQLLNAHADGLSLPAYINNVRLDVAYALLRDGPDKSISDIAADVGFTPQNLRLQFKKRYGITPTEYRQNR